MAQYQWDARLLSRVFVLPAAVVDEHLKLAGSVQLKVLLWFSCHGDGGFDAAACAKAVGLSAPDCLDALQYWVQAGVLQEAGAPQVQPATAAETVSMTLTTLPAPRPKAVKPQMTEVIAEQEKNREFSYLLEAVSGRLGRALSPGDMETLLYLHRSAGLPAEVILMVVGYALSAEKLNMRYIEKVALDWADKGIVTMAAAEEYLCRLEHRNQAVEILRRVCDNAEIKPTVPTMDAAEKWIYQWHISEEVLRLGYDACMEKLGKFQARYMDRILEGWREDGDDTEEKITARRRGKKKAVTPATAENEEYESMVERYLPKYTKKR